MPSENTILLAIELSVSTWLVAYRLPDTEKCRLHRIAGGDVPALLALISGLRSRASADLGSVDVACCFEAGRDGVWLHRLLTARGVAAYVLEPTSILVSALVIDNPEALSDEMLQVDPPPAHDAMHSPIWASLDELGQLGLLLGGQAWRIALPPGVPQPLRAALVEAVDPVA
jgi:hypothetical protein